MNRIRFWNGNKSPVRQEYELELLRQILKATSDDLGAVELLDDRTDFPQAEEEASVFRVKDFDVFATVAGNQKLHNEEKIIVHRCIMEGLLGYRILIVRKKDREVFEKIQKPEQLQPLAQGIPATWADAELFRRNGYRVIEKGDFHDQFEALDRGDIDYVCFGANEIEDIFRGKEKAYPNLTIEDRLVLYYPFPLVYYVNPRRDDLAFRIETGFERIVQNGVFEKLFQKSYAHCIETFHLPSRKKIHLENPFLPFEMQGCGDNPLI